MVRKKPRTNLVKCTKKSCADKPPITDHTTGEIVCSGCGRILQENATSHEAEYRSFNKEQYNSRTRTGAGTSLRIHDRGLSTVIGSQNQDSSGRPLPSSTKNKFYRLRMWDSRSKSKSTERNLRQALVLLDTVRTKLALPEMVGEEAAQIYRKANSNKLASGRSIPLLVAAAIYTACRSVNIPRNLTDVAKASNVNRKSLSRMYRTLADSLKLSYTPYEPKYFISRLASALKIKESTKRESLKILAQAREKGLSSGKKPMGLAAASLYIACKINGEKKSQRQMSEVSGISHVTIRKQGEIIAKALKINLK